MALNREQPMRPFLDELADAFEAYEIPAGSIGTNELSDGAVTSPKIADGAVNMDKLASDVLIPQPTDAQVTSAVNTWLAAHPEATTTVQDGAVTTAKLADGAVTDAKLKQEIGVLSDLKDFNAYNLLNPLTHLSKTHNNVTWTWEGNECSVSGTASATENNDMFASANTLPEGFVAGETYHVRYASTGVNLRIYAYPSNGSLTEIYNATANGNVTIPANAVGLIIRLNIPANTPVNETIAPAILKALPNSELEDVVSCLESSLNATQNGHSELFGYGTFANGTLFNGSLRSNVKYRIASTSMLEFDYNITLEVSDTFKFGVHTFADGSFSADTGWHTSPYTIAANTQFKVLIARRSENTSEIADIPTFMKQVTFQTDMQQSIENALSYVDTLPRAVANIAEELLSQGSFDNQGGDDSFAATARAKTGLLFAINDIAVYADNVTYPYAGAYVHYFDNDANWVRSSGWQGRVVIPKGSTFKLLLAKVYNSAAAVSVSDIYACFDILSNNKINNIRPCVVVSHQGNVNLSENHEKAEGYIEAGLAGFDYAECDVKFTSDDVPVCSHDGTFTDATTEASVRIESYTFTEIQEFDFYGGTIASLDKVVQICKRYGMGLYIDQYQSSWSDARYDAIFEILNKYRFAKFCKHIVYDSVSAGKILARDKTAWVVCGQLYSSTAPDSAIQLADSVVTDYNRVDVMFSKTLGLNVVQSALPNIDARYGINVYVLDTASEKSAWAPYITSITTSGDKNVYY